MANASFKETRDFILISYDISLINDKDFLLLLFILHLSELKFASQPLLEPSVIPTTIAKQNNTKAEKNLSFSSDKLFA